MNNDPENRRFVRNAIPYYILKCNGKVLAGQDGRRSDIFESGVYLKGFEIQGPCTVVTNENMPLTFANADPRNIQLYSHKYTEKEAHAMVAKRDELLKSPYGTKFLKEKKKSMKVKACLKACLQERKSIWIPTLRSKVEDILDNNSDDEEESEEEFKFTWQETGHFTTDELVKIFYEHHLPYWKFY